MTEIIDFINDSLFDSDKKSYVYVLLLEDNYFYVGCTNNLLRRIKQHMSGNASEWTKLHKPIKILNIFEGSYEEEKNETLRLMKKKGSKVRGSYWCQVEMENPPLELYEHFNRKKPVILKTEQGKHFQIKYDANGKPIEKQNRIRSRYVPTLEEKLYAFKKLAEYKPFKYESIQYHDLDDY